MMTYIPFLIEGDPSIPDVQNRFQSTCAGVSASLQRADAAEETIVDLAGLWEQQLTSKNPPTHFVINLPGGAGSTVDPHARALIQPVAQALGLEVVTLFLIGPGVEALDVASSSLESGLVSISDQKIAVANLHLGDPVRFGWATSNIREEWIAGGGIESSIPALLPRVSEKIRDIEGPFFEIVTGKTGQLTIAERSVLHRWLTDSENICGQVLDGCERPKLIFVHGEKGGVGKSITASLLIDFMLNKNSVVMKNE